MLNVHVSWISGTKLQVLQDEYVTTPLALKVTKSKQFSFLFFFPNRFTDKLVPDCQVKILTVLFKLL